MHFTGIAVVRKLTDRVELGVLVGFGHVERMKETLLGV